MDQKHDPEVLSDQVRSESVRLVDDDSLEDIISSLSKHSSSNEESKVVDRSLNETETRSNNDETKSTESKLAKLYKSMGLIDLKSIDTFKRFLSNPLASESDREKNDIKIDTGCSVSDEMSYSTTTTSDIDESHLLMDDADVEITSPLKLKDLMIYKTIQFMDYRRLSRRFNGIRKPVSNKKALFICLFCASLALVPFIVFRKFENYYTISIQVKKGALPHISSLAFLLAAFLLAKVQLSLPLRFPVFVSYLFMITTVIVLIVLRNISDLDKFIWRILIGYASAQIFVIVLTKIIIHIVPVLALNGHFFPCTEHFHLLKRSQHSNKLNITMSRYNDYTSIFDTRSCGLLTCLYRSFYRLFLYIRRRTRKHETKMRDSPLFGHQMRYNGKYDSNNLPHGYGEWLEDHIYGERLQGYWWHGYPVGPFTSQEIGSGSIFVNNRVAFVTDTTFKNKNIRYGVSSTECSISGHFFRQMPKTYFFNPEYREHKQKKNKVSCELFHLLSTNFDGIRTSTPKWCIGMLKRQFHLNRPNNQGYMSIYVDKLTNSLKIDGYRIKRAKQNVENPEEITIKLVKYHGLKNKVKYPKNENQSPVEINVFKPFTNRFFRKSRNSSKDEKKLSYQSKISMLIRDEDDWENKQQMSRHRIVANGWTRIRPSTKKELIPEHVLIYIHGYNLTLNQACSQMAHIVSFAKLPPYILPFVFNWKGKEWGIFSAFSYPKAIKTTENPNIVEAFIELIKDLIELGIKHIHFIVHSCGARVFFKVILPAIENGFIVPVLNQEYLVVDTQDKEPRLRMNTVILISPDYPMERFRANDYFILRGYCDHIVMYVNNMDQCLWVSEFYNKEKSLGKSIFEMCTSPSIISKILKKEVDNEPFTIYDGNYNSMKSHNEWKYGSEDHKVVIMEEDDIERDERATNHAKTEDEEVLKTMKKPSRFEKIFKPRYSMNKYRKTKNIFWTSRSSTDIESVEDMYLWLDMDVIDTSMIDTNVDFLKHSFYQVKREIMDDIREVIVLHTRADQRQSRLDRRRGNVYVFRVAPGDVTKLI